MTDSLAAALRSALDAGTPPPCAGPYLAVWTSDDPADREIAAELCAPCPIFAACHQTAQTNRERFHVWAGVDRTAHPKGRAA